MKMTPSLKMNDKSKLVSMKYILSDLEELGRPRTRIIWIQQSKIRFKEKIQTTNIWPNCRICCDNHAFFPVFFDEQRFQD